MNPKPKAMDTIPPIPAETAAALERTQANHRGARLEPGRPVATVLGVPYDPTRRCPCGAPADREELELAALFPDLVPHCAECTMRQTRQARARQENEARRREQAQREARLAVIPPEILETSTAHQGFNAGLWIRIEAWRPSCGHWLGVIGRAGQCKTRCVGLLVAELIREGLHVEWQSMADLQSLTERHFAGTDPERRAVLERFDRLKTCGLLVLDDWGKNTWPPALERRIFEIIDHRKSHHLPLVWTANTHPAEILQAGEMSKDRGGPIVGRLLEATGARGLVRI